MTTIRPARPDDAEAVVDAHEAASTMLHAMTEWMTRRGVTSASLWVAADNAPARRFYEREGWALSGEERASPLGPNEVRYDLHLGNIT